MNTDVAVPRTMIGMIPPTALLGAWEFLIQSFDFAKSLETPSVDKPDCLTEKSDSVNNV